MSCDNAKCDTLWAGESLVSENCRYLFVMEPNGNLAMYGNPDIYEDPCTDGANEGCRRRRLQNIWYFGCNSNTSIYNYSGQSVPKFTLETDGTLSIWEYIYRNVPSIPPLLLWSINTGITGNNLEFGLSNSGCLSLNKVNGDSEDPNVPKWELCSTFDSVPNHFTISGSAVDTLLGSISTSTTMTQIIATETSLESTGSIGMDSAKLDVVSTNSRWTLIVLSGILVLMLCIIIVICVCIRKRCQGEDKWISSDEIMKEAMEQKVAAADSGEFEVEMEGIEGDLQTSQQLEQWSRQMSL